MIKYKIMDINYFLLIKKKYDAIIANVDVIISEFDDIRESNINIQKYTELNKIFNTDTNTQFFVEKRNHIQHLKNMCNQYIYSLCDHEFIDDVIDIDPDTSQTIIYCQICGLGRRL